jgi:hypothetical protein
VGVTSQVSWLIIEDLHGDGAQYSMDATMAYRQAALNCMDYIRRLGYSREQAREWKLVSEVRY